MYNTPFPTQSAVQAPPAPNPPTGPTGGKRSWPRLALLVLVVIVAASFLPATLPKAASAARKAAYPKPAISISVGGSSFQTGQSVTFTVNVQSGKNLKFDWSVNDQAYTGPSITTSFTDPGQETVHVTATDPIGQTADAQTSVNVLPPPPVACFTANPDSYSTYYYYFDASCSQGQIQQYVWTFGDNSSPDTTYGGGDYHDYYPNTGTFTVTLTVTDNYNQSNSVTRTITVTG